MRRIGLRRPSWTRVVAGGALLASVAVALLAPTPAFAQRRILPQLDGPRVYGNPEPVPGEITARPRAGGLRDVVRFFRSDSGVLTANVFTSAEGSALPSPVPPPRIGAHVPFEEPVVLDFAGDGLVRFQVDPSAARRLRAQREGDERDGQVRLDSGTVGDLLPTVVNRDGVVEARKIVERDGVIRLVGDPRPR